MHDKLRILKFGSSVLRDETDIVRVVSEIYRHHRRARPVIAVVSAFEGRTDQLMAEASKIGLERGSEGFIRLVTTGEYESGLKLIDALKSIGMGAELLSPREMKLIAHGGAMQARPVAIDTHRLTAALNRSPVLVVPGFSAVGPSGETVLLGRGGSDMTAIFLASETGAGKARLLKDVDGVYERDPNSFSDAKRYTSISWSDAGAVSQDLIQPKAIAFAADHGVEIEIARIGQRDETRIGKLTEPPLAPSGHRRLKVALAGCGTVGGGVLDRLLGEPDRFELTGILVREPHRYGHLDASLPIMSDREKLLQSGADVLVETINGANAAELHLAAFRRGMHVVSANKQAVASDLQGLLQTAAIHSCIYRYSACVGGGAPMLECVAKVRSETPITALAGILSGTVNFILTEMEAGRSFETALARAQDAGLAEANPEADLSGQDALAKLRLLAFSAFGTTGQDLVIPVAQLNADGEAPGLKLKSGTRQIARLTQGHGRLGAEIGFEPTPSNSLFRTTTGEQVALAIETATDEVHIVRGKGAGRVPTAESIMGDLGEIERRTN